MYFSYIMKGRRDQFIMKKNLHNTFKNTIHSSIFSATAMIEGRGERDQQECLMEGKKGGKNLARLAVRRSTCRSLFMVRWLNHRYSCFLFLLSIQDSWRALNRDMQPSFPQTWLLVSALSILGFTTFRDSINQIWRVVTRVERHLAGRLSQCPLSPREKHPTINPSMIPPANQPTNQPTNQATNQPTNQLPQLTHCWFGMATDVSRSAMAPRSWSVRPWFFCRAFILPQEEKKHYAEIASLLPPVLTFAPLFSAVCVPLLPLLLSRAHGEPHAH